MHSRNILKLYIKVLETNVTRAKNHLFLSPHSGVTFRLYILIKVADWIVMYARLSLKQKEHYKHT